MARGKTEKKTYLKISEGKIREKVDESTQGAVKREYEDNDGNKKVIYEIVDDFVEGYFRGLTVHSHPSYGDSYNLLLEDGTETFTLQFKCGSSVASAIISKIPNLNLEQRVSVHPYYFIDEGKIKTPVVLMQAGQKVESFWTREDPKGLTPFPDTTGMDERKRKRAFKAAMTDRLEEMEAYVMKVLDKAMPESKADVVVPKLDKVEHPDADETSLPF